MSRKRVDGRVRERKGGEREDFSTFDYTISFLRLFRVTLPQKLMDFTFMRLENRVKVERERERIREWKRDFHSYDLAKFNPIFSEVNSFFFST